MMPTDRQPDAAACMPMRILDARTSTDHRGRAMLTVLVDRIPRLDELTYRVIEIGHVRPLPATVLYVGIHPDGYIVPLVDIGDGRGFYGQTFHLRTDDGTVRRVVGPYPAPVDLVRVFAADIDIRTDIALVDDPGMLRQHRDESGAVTAFLTAAVRDTALHLVTAHHQAEHGYPTNILAAVDPALRNVGGRR